MRKILFRGKSSYTGDWAEGFYHKRDYAFNGETVRRHYILPLNAQDAVCVDPDTVGQYTGIDDKDGKKSFEGDVIKHYNNPSEPEDYVVGVIYWDECRGQWRKTSLHDKDGFNIASFCLYEVIGNIHDNPELIGGTE